MDFNSSENVEKTDNDDDTSLINIHVIVLGYIIFPAISVFGLTGNILVIYSVLSDTSKRTVTNMFLFNLAVANIFFSLFIVPIRPVHVFASGWPFGSSMCHLWPCIYYSACYALMVTLASISVNRYLVVVHRSPPEMKTKGWMAIMVIIWVVSIAVSVPFGYVNGLRYHHINENSQYISCDPLMIKENIPFYYFLPVFVLFFVIPLIVTASFYIALCIKMSTNEHSAQLADKRRTNRLLIIMATVIFIVLMPYHVIELLCSYFWPFVNKYHIKTSLNIAHLMAMTSVCFSPLFYMWLNKITIKQFCLVGPCFNRSNRENEVKSSATTYNIINDEDKANDVTYNAQSNEIGLIQVHGKSL